MPQILQAVVFDFDGTLADLTIDFQEMRHQVTGIASRLGIGRDGLDNVPVLEWLEQQALTLEPTKPDLARSLLAQSMAAIIRIETEAAQSSHLFEFTKDMLQRLKEMEVKTAIITRNLAAVVELVFPDWKEYCRVLLARDHVRRVKPHPGHLLEALNNLGASPGKSLMVGDHPLDIETARRAGAMAAGVASGHISLAELMNYGPDLAAADCLQLMRRLEESGLLPV